MRRAAKVDDNQNDVVDRFRELGCSVAITSKLGQGFSDLVVGLGGFNVLVEVKDGSKPPSKRKLTDDEQKFMEGWRGEYRIVETLADVDALVAEVRTRVVT